MKIVCRNCRLECSLDFPTTRCNHCWEVFNVKHTDEYISTKKILNHYGIKSKQSKELLKAVLNKKSDILITKSVLVKLAFSEINYV